MNACVDNKYILLKNYFSLCINHMLETLSISYTIYIMQYNVLWSGFCTLFQQREMLLYLEPVTKGIDWKLYFLLLYIQHHLCLVDLTIFLFLLFVVNIIIFVIY